MKDAGGIVKYLEKVGAFRIPAFTYIPFSKYRKILHGTNSAQMLALLYVPEKRTLVIFMFMFDNSPCKDGRMIRIFDKTVQYAPDKRTLPCTVYLS
jgi:hypothetical protein